MKKGVSKRYSDKELSNFKKIIVKKIETAQVDLRLLKDSYSNASSNGTDDTYSSFKSFEEGSETLSKESNTLLASRQEKFIRDLKMLLLELKTRHMVFVVKLENLFQKKDFY